MFFIKTSCYFEESPYICPREISEMRADLKIYFSFKRGMNSGSVQLCEENMYVEL